jgi:hypothetical protein
LKEDVADRIALATGANPLWLFGHVGKATEPLNVFGDVYSSEDLPLPQKTRTTSLPRDIDPDGDASACIHSLCHTLTHLMRAAYRKGKLGMAMCFFRKLERQLNDKLGLRGLVDNDRVNALERDVFGPDNTLYQNDPGEIDILWRLLSPTASIKWSDAWNGSKTDRERFLNDLVRVQDVVEDSFERRSSNEEL